LKQEQNIPGAVVASARRCLYAIIRIENFQIKNPLNSSRKKQKHCIYAGVHAHKRRLTAMAAIIAREFDGY
jgi:hypothetical protein